MDDESMDILVNGASVTMISRHLNVKPENMRKRIIAAGLRPKSQISGVPRYDVFEVGGIMQPPSADQVEHYMRNATHHDVPPLLNKATWDGIDKRMTVEQRAGELWHTEEVVAGFGAMAKIVKMAMLTLPDQLHRKQSLSSAQRRVVDTVVKDALEAIKGAIYELFSRNPDAAGAVVVSVENDPAAGIPDPTWDL